MAAFRKPCFFALLGSASMIALTAAVDPVLANPVGGVVEAGGADIGRVNGDTTIIRQHTQRAIINWDSFNVGEGQTTQFVLPDAKSVTLNRDHSGNISEIHGHLVSNGRLFLVNPNGILFGRNSRVDVAGLVATTHDIRSQDFMAGNYQFTIPGRPGASVVNQGQISVQDLGFGAFVAPHVRNEGAVVARMGRIELASGSGFTLDMYGDGLISFLVENPNDHQIVGANGEPVSALVENIGQLIADGGVVAMTAYAARGVIDSVINTDGIVQANTVEKRGGRIILGGGGTGAVRTAGRVQARGENEGERGGSVEVTGEVVVADTGSVIDASGMDGGGTILFGGDYLGGNTTNADILHFGIELEEHEVPSARRTFVAEGARLSADALGVGDGGKLIVWSDEATLSFGTLTARGGPGGGDGGFIETSGEYLAVDGTVDASAPNGRAGTWLLDPLDIAIDNLTNGRVAIDFGVDIPLFVGGSLNATTFTPTGSPSIVAASMLETSLNAGTNTVVTTFNTTGSGSGNIFLRTDINKTAGGDAVLGLYAVGDILISAGVNVTSTSGRLSFDLFGRGIEAGNMGQLRLNGGSLFLLPGFGATLTTASPMPNLVGITHRTSQLGGGQGRINLRFGQNRANYNYTADWVEYRTGAVDLRDSRSSGRLEMRFDRPIELRYHNLSVVHDQNHGFLISPLASAGAVRSSALDGIPEIVSGATLQTPFLAEPSSGIVPVNEVSLTFSERVDDYRIRAASGEALLDAHLASLRPRAPVEQVVQQAAEPVVHDHPRQYVREREVIFGIPELDPSASLGVDLGEMAQTTIAYDALRLTEEPSALAARHAWAIEHALNSPSVQRRLEKLAEKYVIALAGAGAGAVAGTVVFPGVGTAVGAAQGFTGAYAAVVVKQQFEEFIRREMLAREAGLSFEYYVQSFAQISDLFLIGFTELPGIDVSLLAFDFATSYVAGFLLAPSAVQEPIIGAGGGGGGGGGQSF